MRIIQNFIDTELEEILNDFYEYFETGFSFENFLKPFLESIGLSEVVITQKTRDGGIDLMAVKEGLSEINNADSVKYRVQAKRNKPASTISPEKIDALRGNLAFNEKGLFITTAKVSNQAKEKAISKDPYKPIFVIDGIDLIRICIERQIGFAYKPIFSKEALDDFTCKFDVLESKESKQDNVLEVQTNVVEKIITANDVRCNLISVPRYIVERIEKNQQKQKLNVVVNATNCYTFTYSPARKYLYIPNSKGFFMTFGIKRRWVYKSTKCDMVN